jgi:hypothetical protein
MDVSTKDWREVAKILKHKLAFDALRPGQREALESTYRAGYVGSAANRLG